jgi:serine phosphatase RsbU (regulator of sigma subunit)
MVSDGALSDGDNTDYISDVLKEKNIADEPPQKIADKLLRRVKAENTATEHGDDVSIVVLKIKKEVCPW